MTFDRALELISKITYKPEDASDNWLGLTVMDGTAVSLVVTFNRPDSDRPNEAKVLIGSNKIISPYEFEMWDDQAFVKFVRDTIVDLEVHEVDEFFKVDGKHLSNPHE